MACPDMSALRAKYQESVEEYIVVVKRLRDHATGVSQVEFMQLWHAAESAKDKAVEAQRILEYHIADHDCSSPLTTSSHAMSAQAPA